MGFMDKLKQTATSAKDSMKKSFDETSAAMKAHNEESKELKKALDGAIARYEVTYVGGLPEIPKRKSGAIGLNIMPDKFAECVCSLLKYGVKVIGGCCGTNPDYIAKIKSEVADREYQPQTKSVDTTVCSSTTVVEINGPRIIGERINPTGKKLFKQALNNDDIDYILGQAIEQVGAGADILDVNVGLPDIDEKAMMIKAV